MNNERDKPRIRRTPGEVKSASPHSDTHSNHSELDLSGTMGSGEVERKDAAEITEPTMQSGSLKGDRASVALLICLYILQGIPLGLSASIPYLLQSRKVSYKDQAVFSFVSWPFSLKLLWAPIVDSVYLASFGRRKSWLIPTQYLIGAFMLLLSGSVRDLMGDGEAGRGGFSVVVLTAVFFMLNFLAATQDIAVDGWALNMLSKRNVGWVSTCNTVGQTAGYFLGNVVFLALESADFCNRYLRTEPLDHGVVTLPGFFFFWGIVFFVSTTLVLLLKKEIDCTGAEHRSTEADRQEDTGTDKRSDVQVIDPCQTGVVDAYRQLWRICKLSAVLRLIAVLLTIKVGFAAADAVTGLKLLEEGVPKEHLALMAVPMVPIDILLPVLITKYMSSQRPLNLLLRGMPFRLMIGLIFALIVWWAPSTKGLDGAYPAYFYFVMFLGSVLHQVAVYSMFVPMMAFFAKVSDPVMGGTYMTLLNTISNLGGNWPSTTSLMLVEPLTWKGCVASTGSCTTVDQDCSPVLKSCTILDGYYVLSIACVIIGFVWLRLFASRLRQLQEMPAASWRCS